MLLRRRMEGLRSKQCSLRGLTMYDFPFLCGVCHSARPPFMEHVQSSVLSPYDPAITLLAACSEGALNGVRRRAYAPTTPKTRAPLSFVFIVSSLLWFITFTVVLLCGCPHHLD